MLMKMKIKKVSEELTSQVDTLKSSLVNYRKKVYEISEQKYETLLLYYKLFMLTKLPMIGAKLSWKQ